MRTQMNLKSQWQRWMGNALLIGAMGLTASPSWATLNSPGTMPSPEQVPSTAPVAGELPTHAVFYTSQGLQGVAVIFIQSVENDHYLGGGTCDSTPPAAAQGSVVEEFIHQHCTLNNILQNSPAGGSAGLYFQPRSNRYVMVGSYSGVMPQMKDTIESMQFMMFIDLSDLKALMETFAFDVVVDGANPDLESQHMTFVEQAEATFLYPNTGMTKATLLP